MQASVAFSDSARHELEKSVSGWGVYDFVHSDARGMYLEFTFSNEWTLAEAEFRIDNLRLMTNYSA